MNQVFSQIHVRFAYLFFIIQCSSSILGAKDITLDRKKDGTYTLCESLTSSVEPLGFDATTLIQFKRLRCLVKIEFDRVLLDSLG